MNNNDEAIDLESFSHILYQIVNYEELEPKGKFLNPKMKELLETYKIRAKQLNQLAEEIFLLLPTVCE